MSDGLRVDAGFERVSPLGDGGSLTGSTAVTGGLEYTRPESWRGTLRTEYRAANEGDQLLASAGYVRKLGSDWSLLGRSTVSWFTNGPDRLFERTRIGFAWRETESNRWNALGRYEHRYERDDGTLFGTSATRHAANILSFHGNYQSSGAWSIRARAAGKLASDVDDGIETRSNAGILSVRSTVELSRLLDLGLIGRSHWTNGFESHRFGLGVEAGVNVSGLRLYGGYNVFGVSDRDLLESTMSDHGLYLGFGLKFDESVFGLGDDRAFARPAPPPAIRSGLRSDPVPEVWLANRTRQIPEPIEVETDRPLPEPITINTAHPITMPAASVQLDHDRAEDLIGGVEVEATPQTTLSERRARMLARNSQPHDAPVSLSVPTDVSDTTVEVEQAAAPKRTRATQEGSVDERLEQAPVASAQEHVTPPAKSRAWIGNGNEVYVVIALAALAFLVAAWRRVTSFPT